MFCDQDNCYFMFLAGTIQFFSGLPTPDIFFTKMFILNPRPLLLFNYMLLFGDRLIKSTVINTIFLFSAEGFPSLQVLCLMSTIGFLTEMAFFF